MYRHPHVFPSSVFRVRLIRPRSVNNHCGFDNLFSLLTNVLNVRICEDTFVDWSYANVSSRK